jgi:hypothetical protein
MGRPYWRWLDEASPVRARLPAALRTPPAAADSPAAAALAASVAARNPIALSLISLDGTAKQPDQRGSRRIILAVGMLRRGDDIDQIAHVAGLPRLLIELIRDELEKDEPEGADLRNRVDHRFDERLRGLRRRSRQARQVAIVTAIIELAAFANIAAAITALIRHSVDIGVVTGVMALALMLAVWTLARAVTPIRPIAPHAPPPEPGARDRTTRTDDFTH